MLTKYFDGEREVETDTKPEVAEQLTVFKRQDDSARRKARRHNEASLDDLYERTGWEPANKSVNIEADYIAREEKETLTSAISKLTEKQRRLIKLYYFEGKTMRQIAGVLKIHFSNVKRQLETIVKMLRKYF